MPFCIGWVENFDEITLCCTVKKIEANSCFSIFGKNSKWPPFFGKRKFFLKIANSTFLRHPMGRKFQRNNYFAKIRKFKMAAIFGEGKYF